MDRFDRGTETFTRFYEKDGLPSDVIYGILEDDHGYLWISTENGISKFDPQAETFRNYDARDGLQGNEFGWAFHRSARTGTMYFGGTRGFNSFHPDSVRDDRQQPAVVLTDLQIFNESVPIGSEDAPLQQHLSETDHLMLSYDDKVFTIRYAALHYAVPEKNQYAYWLEGFDEDWQYVGNKREVTYTNLDPGEYRFRVKGSNEDGIWNEERASLRLTIRPPWWRTRWVYALYGVLFVLGMVTVDRVQRRRLIQKERQRSALEQAELKERAAKAVADIATARVREAEAEKRALEAENQRKEVELMT